MSDDRAQSKPPASKARVFRRRLITTLALWAIILGALFSGRAWLSNSVFLVVMLLLTVTGMLEFYGMAGRKGMRCFRGFGVACGVALVAASFVSMLRAPAHGVLEVEGAIWVVLALGLGLRQLGARNNPNGLQAIGMTLLGVVYVAWLLNFTQKIMFYPGVNGTFYLLYFILVTKMSDSGAYAVGSLFGRHKMIPRISPGKTWEGFAGAVLVPVGVSLLFAWAAGDRLAGMTPLHAALLGLLLGLGAVAGDLVESMFKREAGVKDSGGQFPGIGGILDLIDSLLFNGPLMYLYLRLVLT